VTYYYSDDNPVFSHLVTELEFDGSLRIYFPGVTGGETATRVLGLADNVSMDPEQEIPRAFEVWSCRLREAGICESIAEVDLVEMRVFGCQPKSPNPLTDPAGYAAEAQRLRQAYARGYAAYFSEKMPDRGLPTRFTVHLADVPDTAASYEFSAVGLLQPK
jgi:hypothetical protein